MAKLPPGLDAFPKSHQRYILENHWPAEYAMGQLFHGQGSDGSPYRVDKYTISDAARCYEAGIAYARMIRRLAADAGQSVRTVPPIAKYHTENPTAAELFAAAGNTFAAEVARLAASEGRAYRLFIDAVRKAERILETVDEKAVAA
jgi:hypothetical protein